MKILCIGDIVGQPGRDAVKELLPELKKELELDVVVANAENAAAGFGVTPRLANQLFESGCNVLTLGDHTWDKQELMPYLSENEDRIIRPANFPADVPGKGWCLYESRSGYKIGIINLLGRVFMRYNVDCPFRKLEEILQQIRKQTNIIVVDMHAEATSEKVALGHFANGKISAIVGTHTHVQTADEKVLSGGTAYLTDLGMTGPHDSVIGQNKEKIIKRFLTSLPERFEIAQGDVILNAALIDIDEDSGRARSISRIQRRLQ
jgi:hypothetical protein